MYTKNTNNVVTDQVESVSQNRMMTYFLRWGTCILWIHFSLVVNIPLEDEIQYIDTFNNKFEHHKPEIRDLSTQLWAKGNQARWECGLGQAYVRVGTRQEISRSLPRSLLVWVPRDGIGSKVPRTPDGKTTSTYFN